jgi:hypothetical protein
MSYSQRGDQVKLRNWFFRQLVERGLIKEKYEYYTDEEKRTYDLMQEELRKLEAGEEIEPPWGSGDGIFYIPMWAGSWRCGPGEWRLNIWYSFWEKLNDEQKQEYLEKYKAPPEDWYQHLVVARTVGREWNTREWLNEQKDKIEAGEEIAPPWVTFPISLAKVGWDDFWLEDWKLEVWTPFWEQLSETERKAYLEKWSPPSKEWEENITEHWVGKIRKSETWFERQKFFLENQDSYLAPTILLPWQVFQKILSKKTFWDAEFIEQWLNEVWLPFWNIKSEEEQDNYLDSQSPPNDEWLSIFAKYKVNNLRKLKEMKKPDFN